MAKTCILGVAALLASLLHGPWLPQGEVGPTERSTPFKVAKKTRLGDLVLSMQVRVSPALMLLEDSGELPAGLEVRSIAFSALLGRYTDSTIEVVVRSDGTRLLPLADEDAMVYSGTIVVEFGELADETVEWKLSIRPDQELIWAEVNNEEALQVELDLGLQG